MIVLCGFSVSNYYNKVKLALLEKNVPFTEEVVKTMSQDAAVLSASPLGKIPYIRTPHGPLSESQAILNYLELAYPNPSLLPADAFAAGKVHELTTYIDLHLELVARELYGKAFFGGEISEGNAARVRKQLVKNIAAFKSLAKFSPFVAGDTFTQADCAAWVSLPLVAMASKAVLGEDLLAAAGVDWRAYGKIIAERPSAQRVNADKKTDAAKLAAAKSAEAKA